MLRVAKGANDELLTCDYVFQPIKAWQAQAYKTQRSSLAEPGPSQRHTTTSIVAYQIWIALGN